MRICEDVTAAAVELRELRRAGRPAMLRSMAAALDARREELVTAADRETGLGSGWLGGS